MKSTLLCLITITIAFGQLHLGDKPQFDPRRPNWMKQHDARELESLRQKVASGNGTNEDDICNLKISEIAMGLELAMEAYIDKFGLDFPGIDPGYEGEVTHRGVAFSSDAFAEWYNQYQTTDLESSTPDHSGISDESPKIKGLRFSNADDYLRT